MKDIEAACQAIWAGAKLYVASDVPFFATKQGRTMGYSYAIVGAIRRMTKAPFILTGKPSLHALRFAARRLGIPMRSLGVVGDDPAVEIIMARRGGATAFGVTTGVTKSEDWARADRQPAAAPRAERDSRSSQVRPAAAIRPRLLHRKCARTSTMAAEGELLWRPSAARREKSHVTHFVDWLRRERGLTFDDYQALWRWSVQDLEAFWAAIWDYFQVRSSAPYTQVLGASRDARRPVVPGSATQLRRACAGA